MQIQWKQLGFPSCLAAVLSWLPPKKCQTLDEYSEKTVRGATSYKQITTILQYDDTFFLVENSIVSEQEMFDYAHRKSWPRSAIFDSPTVESQ